MIVLVVSACPVGLRGHLTRWLLEISPGVFVGKVSRRVRDLLWVRVIEMAGPGRAILVFSSKSEQGLGFKIHDHEWKPVDYDGLTLIRKPHKAGSASAAQGARAGWSSASKRRKFGRR